MDLLTQSGIIEVLVAVVLSIFGVERGLALKNGRKNGNSELSKEDIKQLEKTSETIKKSLSELMELEIQIYNCLLDLERKQKINEKISFDRNERYIK